LRAHSEAKGEAIQKQTLDCFVALLLAMTRALGQFRRNPLLGSARQIVKWLAYLLIDLCQFDTLRCAVGWWRTDAIG
jgi:hypothetical protein